jgi:5-methyltetrahydropteroyltriglutamate--homocysteine methyltransferase
MTHALPVLPTSVVGSHGLPGWVELAREAMAQQRLGQVDLRELMEDATLVALRDQELAGVDVVSTGEMMRVRFIVGFYDRLTGLRPLPPPRRLGPPLWDTHHPFEVFEKIAAPTGLGIVEEFALARSLTARPLKATVPGPYTLLVPLRLGGAYRDKETLLADLVGIVNAECRALVDAGADFIQVDEPHHGMYAGAVPEVAKGINRAVEGVRAKVAVHICFGNLYGRPFSAVRDYRNVLATVDQIRAAQVVLEFANRGLEDVALLADWPRDKELGAGVIDVKAFKAETAQDVADRARRLLRYLPAERLWLNPDCGFWETPRWICRQKLQALVGGARLVRQELGDRRPAAPPEPAGERGAAGARPAAGRGGARRTRGRRSD